MNGFCRVTERAASIRSVYWFSPRNSDSPHAAGQFPRIHQTASKSQAAGRAASRFVGKMFTPQPRANESRKGCISCPLRKSRHDHRTPGRGCRRRVPARQGCHRTTRTARGAMGWAPCPAPRGSSLSRGGELSQRPARLLCPCPQAHGCCQPRDTPGGGEDDTSGKKTLSLLSPATTELSALQCREEEVWKPGSQWLELG